MEISEVLPSHLNITTQLAEIDHRPKFTGNYSTVYKGSLNGQSVAIKVMRAMGRDEAMVRKVLREVTLWESAKHRNVHPFHGFVDDARFGDFGGLVSPWCLNGDANQYLKLNGGRMITAERVNLWGGVIEGVAYLHRRDPVIVHGDLKPGNILIDDHGVPRICDFGLARVLHEGESMGMTTTSEHTGTERYLAPELVISDVNVYPTMESDVYALGCLGLEVRRMISDFRVGIVFEWSNEAIQFIYDQKPYAHRANNLRGGIIIDIRNQIPPAMSPPHRSWAVNHFWPLIQQLWNTDPRYRPSAFNAVFRLSIATRNLPSTVLQLIIQLSEFASNIKIYERPWKDRTACLRNLCLVSRSFRAWTTPILYRNIRIVPSHSLSFQSQLKYTFGHSATNKLTYGATPTGYGSYTKHLHLCLTKGFDFHSISSDLQDVMLMMSRLRFVKITTYTSMRIVDFGLSHLLLSDIDASCIIGHQSFLHAMPYVELLSIQSCAIEPEVNQNGTQRQYGILILPNLRAMRVHDGTGRNLSEFWRAVTHWVIPNLRTLRLDVWEGLESSYAAFFGLLRVHGSSLWQLELGYHTWETSPLAEVLPLCDNLRSFAFNSRFYISLSHFPAHATLEMLELTTNPREEPAEEGCMSIVQEFASRWRAHLPSLRRIKFGWPSLYYRMFTATFRPEDNFYTFTGNDETSKRYSIPTGSADMSDT